MIVPCPYAHTHLLFFPSQYTLDLTIHLGHSCPYIFISRVFICFLTTSVLGFALLFRPVRCSPAVTYVSSRFFPSEHTVVRPHLTYCHTLPSARGRHYALERRIGIKNNTIKKGGEQWWTTGIQEGVCETDEVGRESIASTDVLGVQDRDK